MILRYMSGKEVSEATVDGENLSPEEDMDQSRKVASTTFLHLIIWYVKAKLARAWYVG